MKKFTLIELLIVTAVIGILVSILMPSLGTAREKAKRVVCLSNQQQMYRNTAIWSKNNNNRLPAANADSEETDKPRPSPQPLIAGATVRAAKKP